MKKAYNSKKGKEYGASPDPMEQLERYKEKIKERKALCKLRERKFYGRTTPPLDISKIKMRIQ